MAKVSLFYKKMFVIIDQIKFQARGPIFNHEKVSIFQRLFPRKASSAVLNRTILDTKPQSYVTTTWYNVLTQKNGKFSYKGRERKEQTDKFST